VGRRGEPPRGANAESGSEIGVLEGVDHLHADVLLHILEAGDIVEFDAGLSFTSH